MGDTEKDLQSSSSGSFDNKESSRGSRPSSGPIGASTTVTKVWSRSLSVLPKFTVEDAEKLIKLKSKTTTTTKGY